MLKKIITASAYVCLIVILGLAIRYFMASSNKPEIDTKPAFNTQLLSPQGVKQNLSQYQGKIIVLNLWATWCPPCREEMPELNALYQDYKDKNVVVIGVALDDLASVITFLKSSPVNYPIYITENEAMDLGAELGNDQGVLPYTVIINSDGSVIKTFFGRISKPLLEGTIKTLLPQ